MQIVEGVDLPLNLIEAQENGTLVLFVGAGASISPPAKLPSFFDLAKKLGVDAQAMPPRDDEPLDQYLGTLVSNGFDAHRHALAVLDNVDSMHNETHRAIVDLALSAKTPRIVTTNFDVLLTDALKERKTGLTRWVGPALPLGDDFAGIVQIHGSIDAPESGIILTDADFGQAYVTRSWASRFLTEVFNSFTVLFVGYSHRDPIMRYFSHGLPRSTSRYAMLGNNDDSEYLINKQFMESFGITVVEYPAQNGHVALPSALKEWARRSRLDKLGVRKEIEEIIRNLDRATPPEKDYLSQQIETDYGIKSFASIAVKLDAAKQQSAYEWLRDFSTFKCLFDRTKSDHMLNGDSLSSLANWAATYFTQDRQTVFEFWRCQWEFGFLLREDFTDLLIARSLELYQRSESWVNSLIIYLRIGVPGLTSPLRSRKYKQYIDDWKRLSEPEFSQILDARVAPDSFAFKYPDLAPKKIEFFPKWDVDADELDHGLSELKASTTLTQTAIMKALVRSLERCHSLLSSMNPSDHYDILTSYRPSIEVGENAYSDKPVNSIVDFLVEYASDSNNIERLTGEWAESDVILLQKAAIYCVNSASTLKPTDRMDWILSRSNFIVSEHHFPEVRKLLEESVTLVTPESRAALIQRVRDEFEVGTTDLKATACLKILHALLETNEAWRDAESLKAEIETRFPDSRRLHSDRTAPQITLEESGFGDFDYNPTLVSDLRQGTNARGLLQSFFQKLHGEPFDGDRKIREECLALNSHSPRLALEVVLEVMEFEEDRFTSRFVIEALSIIDEHVIVDEAETFLKLSNAVGGDVRLSAFARVLERASGEVSSISEISNLEAAIANVWSSHIHNYDREASFDLRFASFLNEWPGILVNSVGRLISARWRLNEDEWIGLPNEVRELLNQLLDVTGPPSSVVAQAFTAHLRFYLNADEDFAHERIMTLFSKDSITRRGAWIGYLARPFYAAEYPVAGAVLSLLYDGWNFISDNPNHPELAKSYFGLIGTIIREAVYPTETIVDFLLKGLPYIPESLIQEYYLHLGKQLGGERGLETWENGIVEFLQKRLNGIPKELSDSERRAIARLPFDATNLAAEIFAVIGDTSFLPIQQVPFHSGLENAPAFQQEILVNEYINRVNRNGIESQLASTWKYHLENPIDDSQPSQHICRLITKLNEFI